MYTKPGKQKILLDRGWDSNPRPSHYQNDALPSELQGQAENDLLSYDVNVYIQTFARLIAGFTH